MIYLIFFCELAELDIFLIILQKAWGASSLQVLLASNVYKMRNWILGCVKKICAYETGSVVNPDKRLPFFRNFN